LISETLGVDDAEQTLLAQRWDWGYGPQPPLYTWLTMIFSAVFGWSTFTMALIKNVLLFGLYSATYFTARRLSRSHAVAVVAAVALQFMPSVVWEAERELTHSILASTMVMVTLWVFVNLKPNRWAGFVLLGICAGFGTISKYNYAVFYAGLLLGALTLPAWRPLILNRRMLAALAIQVIIVAPNLIWALHNMDLATASVYKLKIAPSHSAMTFVKGLASWTQTCLEQAGPALGIFLALFWDSILRIFRVSSEGERLLWRMFLSVGALIGVAVCAFAVTYSHNRWMQPIMVPTPLLLALIWRERLTAFRLKAILWLGATATLIVAVGASGRILLTESLHKYEILNAPFRPLAADIKEAVAKSDYIFANERWLAGNLRIWFPDKGITIPEMTELFKPTTNCILIWDDGRDKSPDRSLGTAEQETGRKFGAPQYFDERFKYHHTNMMRLGVMFPVGKAEPAKTTKRLPLD
jgi:4-amino-4-deoxy-L-arabinose transferase-like glycosyltransferase